MGALQGWSVASKLSISQSMVWISSQSWQIWAIYWGGWTSICSNYFPTKYDLTHHHLWVVVYLKQKLWTSSMNYPLETSQSSSQKVNFPRNKPWIQFLSSRHNFLSNLTFAPLRQWRKKRKHISTLRSVMDFVHDALTEVMAALFQANNFSRRKSCFQNTNTAIQLLTMEITFPPLESSQSTDIICRSMWIEYFEPAQTSTKSNS